MRNRVIGRDRKHSAHGTPGSPTFGGAVSQDGLHGKLLPQYPVLLFTVGFVQSVAVFWAWLHACAVRLRLRIAPTNAPNKAA